MDAGKRRNTWGDILAVIYTEPPGGPISRAQDPEDWKWYLPGYDQLQTITEQLATANVLHGNQSGAKKSELPERAPRPWSTDKETEVKEFKMDPTPLDQLDTWLDSRMN